MDIAVLSRTGRVTFDVSPDEPILYSGLRAGLALPYDCATGTCGMCKARLTEGTVETVWSEAPALAKLQRDRGDILMCQSRATTPCTLRVPGEMKTLPSDARPKAHTGKIQSIQRLTTDVMHFEVGLTTPMRFDAGQFVVLTAPGLTGGRAYSMVNHSTFERDLELVIKKKPGGALSDWLFAADRSGEDVGVFGPLGRATFRPGEDGDLVMIAGGSGIAGMLSILEHATASGHFKRHRGHVYFGVRTLADAFYLDRFATHAAASDGALEIVLALSDERPTTPMHPAYSGIHLAHGYVHDVADAQLAPDCSNHACFVAGPPPMVDGAIRILIGHGVAAPSIRYDKFG